MTTYKRNIDLDDTEALTLRAALALLQEECNIHIANKQAAPWKAYLRSIASIQNKLSNGAEQTSRYKDS